MHLTTPLLLSLLTEVSWAAPHLPPFLPFSELGARAGPHRMTPRGPYTTLDRLEPKDPKTPPKKLKAALGGLRPDEVLYADEKMVIVKGGEFEPRPTHPRPVFVDPRTGQALGPALSIFFPSQAAAAALRYVFLVLPQPQQAPQRLRAPPPAAASAEVAGAPIGHSLAADTRVNRLHPRPPVEPDAETLPNEHRFRHPK